MKERFLIVVVSNTHSFPLVQEESVFEFVFVLCVVHYNATEIRTGVGYAQYEGVCCIGVKKPRCEQVLDCMEASVVIPAGEKAMLMVGRERVARDGLGEFPVARRTIYVGIYDWSERSIEALYLLPVLDCSMTMYHLQRKRVNPSLCSTQPTTICVSTSSK